MSRRSGGNDGDAAILLVGGLLTLAVIVNAIVAAVEWIRDTLGTVLDTLIVILAWVLIVLMLGVVIVTVGVVVVGLALFLRRIVEGRR